MLITWLARARAELGVKALVQFSALVAWVPQRPGSSLLRWRLTEPPGRVLVTGDPWDYSSGLLVSTVAMGTGGEVPVLQGPGFVFHFLYEEAETP